MALSSFSSPFKPTCPLHFPPLPFTNKTTLPFFSLRCSKSSLPEKNDDGENDSRSEPKSPKRLSKQSSWEAKDLEGRDYLYRLGKEADNMNIAVGARAGVIDDLFAGNFLGRDCNSPSPLCNALLRSWKCRKRKKKKGSLEFLVRVIEPF